MRFSESRAAVVKSADHKVQTDYAANVIAVAKDEAIVLVDGNRRDAAAAVLRERTRELEKMADTYGNAAVGRLAAAASNAAFGTQKPRPARRQSLARKKVRASPA